jgi:hypothetical protein
MLSLSVFTAGHFRLALEEKLFFICSSKNQYYNASKLGGAVKQNLGGTKRYMLCLFSVVEALWF